MRVYKDKPPRLHRIYSNSPLYFLTFCTLNRAQVLARPGVHGALQRFGVQAELQGIALGRYVIMPDHIHLFAAPGLQGDLSQTVRLLKRSLSTVLVREGITAPHWQPGFFDHLLRCSESYSEKWAYVCENPVRAGLVAHADDWPFQGEIVPIEW